MPRFGQPGRLRPAGKPPADQAERAGRAGACRVRSRDFGFAWRQRLPRRAWLPTVRAAQRHAASLDRVSREGRASLAGFGPNGGPLRQSSDGRNSGLSGRNASLSSGLSLLRRQPEGEEGRCVPLAEALFRSRQLLSSEIQDASCGVVHERNEYKAAASIQTRQSKVKYTLM